MRTSDTLPQQFQAFYELTKDKQWLTIRDNMLSKLEAISADNKTGLIPDFIWVEGDKIRAADADTVESANDGYYSYNACRLPYNLAQSKDEKGEMLLDHLFQKARTMGIRRLFALSTHTGEWFAERGFQTTSPDALPEERRRDYLANGRNSQVFVRHLEP